MLTAAAVADMLGLSARAVYTLHAQGLLPGYRFGRSVRFDEAEVEAYLASCRVVVAPPAPRWIPPPEPKPRKLTARQLARIEAERVIARQTLVAHHSAKRRAERRNRTPPWVDWQAIKAMHAEARRLTLKTGIPHHVDHVIPLQGDRVSGLHVHTNMQILTGVENSRKKNHFEPC